MDVIAGLTCGVIADSIRNLLKTKGNPSRTGDGGSLSAMTVKASGWSFPVYYVN